MTGPEVVLAVDIGGTKMAAGLVESSGDLLFARSARTPSSPDAEKVFAVLATLVGEALRAPHAPGAAQACGVGCGGPMLRGGTEVSPLNIPAWRGFPLLARLEALTGLPVTIDNDAKALALGEGWQGVAQGRSTYLSMVVSTGVGGGLVVDGRLLDGDTGNAGHIGHLIVEPDGRTCVCGAQGCLEAEVSGPSIAAATGVPPEEATPATIARSGMLVGRAVASVASLLDLHLAAVAGSVALGFGEPFFRAAQEEIDRRARLEFARGCRIVPSGLGSAGPLVGAAAVALRRAR